MAGYWMRMAAGAVMLAAVASPASASDAGDALVAMQELNLIVLGDLDSNQHVQGKAFVGGNTTGGVVVAQGGSQGYRASTRPQLTIGGNSTGFKVETGLGSPLLALIGGSARGLGLNGAGEVRVGGDVDIAGYNPNATKTVTYGGTVSGQQVQDAPYLLRDAGLAAPSTGLAASIASQNAAFASGLTALSLHLRDLTPLATITSTASALNYGGAANGYAVFTMTEAAFEDQNADFDRLFTAMPTGMTTIVNVLGSNLVQGGNINSVALNQTVIWNFADATALSVKGWHGSILAPLATLTNSSAIEGSVAVRNFNMNGEVHLGTYAGTSAFLPGAVPEPATWAMMIGGLGLVGGALRRRKPMAVFA